MTVLGYALALLIGLSLGLLGGGGSILTVPVLHYVMGFGIKEAIPMSLVVVGLTSARRIVLGGVRCGIGQQELGLDHDRLPLVVR